MKRSEQERERESPCLKEEKQYSCRMDADRETLPSCRVLDILSSSAVPLRHVLAPLSALFLSISSSREVNFSLSLSFLRLRMFHPASSKKSSLIVCVEEKEKDGEEREDKCSLECLRRSFSLRDGHPEKEEEVRSGKRKKEKKEKQEERDDVCCVPATAKCVRQCVCMHCMI